MGFESFGQQDHDPARKRRLAVGAGAGLVVLGGLLAVGIAFGAIAPLQQEEEVDVKLVAKVPEAKPPPPPPPPPPRPKSPAPLGAKKASPLTPPTVIPQEKPPETDLQNAKSEIPIGDGDPNGDPNGKAGGRGSGGVAVAPTAPPAPPAPPPPPIQLPEHVDPPQAIHKPMPEYPEAARKQGIETVVIIKFVVTETGEVAEPTILRGHPLLDEAVLATVKTWRFQPAVMDGHAIRVYRVVKIPFKLRT
ncbi:energy transducer TonB [Pendulispora brunnea]|uniref:Energy transducer TonB n=1 Tax=Pendulispora brunnea TaxID=2905690 RepID=A0ABZ2KLX0_9BACT